jgi:hypothetical protein
VPSYPLDPWLRESLPPRNKKQLLKHLSNMGFFSEDEYRDSLGGFGDDGPNLRSGNDAAVAALRFSGDQRPQPAPNHAGIRVRSPCRFRKRVTDYPS